jgi:hypothetical protein
MKRYIKEGRLEITTEQVDEWPEDVEVIND